MRHVATLHAADLAALFSEGHDLFAERLSNETIARIRQLSRARAWQRGKSQRDHVRGIIV